MEKAPQYGSNYGNAPAYQPAVPAPQPMSDAAVGAGFQNQLLAQCARGQHQVTKKYGVCGIICAVCLFPIGLLCLLCDVKKKCERCGQIIE
ncbi:uncharacterized protein B0H18DRAFT_972690 [Fomitopsis serialis]|uniref:uncharacterized protein n=1 Tax=Fomitopsis serialis TaxID=139415 RepID=UPI002008D271|nr:uncharacterized protein B0H18DRAFT_972690 [Neoantrodia serialis]KAH9936182.1 hypothetical protein B0H18DRAFT_972690 [Neoantrodia serialis]